MDQTDGSNNNLANLQCMSDEIALSSAVLLTPVTVFFYLLLLYRLDNQHPCSQARNGSLATKLFFGTVTR